MSKLLTKYRPSPALFVAIVALIVALGGTSFALPGRNTVDANDLRPRVVKAKNLRKGSVSFSKIQNAAVRRRHIREFAVGNRQLANGQISTPKYRDRSVTGSKLAEASVTGPHITSGAVGASKLGERVIRVGNSPLTADADGSPNDGSVGVATATATCAQGERLLSGGARWVTNNTPESTKQLFLRESQPTFTGQGWRAVGNVDFGAQGQARLQAIAVCLR